MESPTVNVDNHESLRLLHAPPLVLRRLTLRDASTVFRLSQEPGMKAWIPDQVYRDEQEAEEVLRFLMSHYHEHASPAQAPYVLGVVLASTGELIGHVGFSPFEQGVEVGYAIGDAHQGRGLAKQAVATASAWALETFHLDAILGVVAEANLASCRVLEASGFREISSTRRTLHGIEGMVKTYRLTP